MACIDVGLPDGMAPHFAEVIVVVAGKTGGSAGNLVGLALFV